MAYDSAPIAQDLAAWLRGRPGVTDVQAPTLMPVLPRPRSRLPIKLPVPMRRSAKPQPSFEIRFSFKGERRAFRYYVETYDDLGTMRATLRVHTTGELMVRVPDEYGHIMANDIHYSNRSVPAAVLGRNAPRQ